MGDPGVDAGEGPQGTVHSEEEDMGDGVDGKQPSGPKITEKNGGEDGQEKTGASAADTGKDPRKIIMSHVKSNWIKDPKEWNAWVGKGVTKEVGKRRHEFQVRVLVCTLRNREPTIPTTPIRHTRATSPTNPPNSYNTDNHYLLIRRCCGCT